MSPTKSGYRVFTVTGDLVAATVITAPFMPLLVTVDSVADANVA